MKKVLIIGTILMMAGMVMGQNYGVIGMPGGSLGGGQMDSIVYKYSSLGSDVNMPTASTWYDGPSITIDSGTWLVQGIAHATHSVTANFFYRITDKTLTYVLSASQYQAALPAISSLGLIMTVSGSKTLYLQGQTSSNNGTLEGATTAQTATNISAIKLSGY